MVMERKTEQSCLCYLMESKKNEVSFLGPPGGPYFGGEAGLTYSCRPLPTFLHFECVTTKGTPWTRLYRGGVGPTAELR